MLECVSLVSEIELELEEHTGDDADRDEEIKAAVQR